MLEVVEEREDMVRASVLRSFRSCSYIRQYVKLKGILDAVK